MKNLFLAIIVVSFGTTAMSFIGSKSNDYVKTIGQNAQYEVPSDVQEIIDNSCFGCHNSDSKSTKGKMKLKFDKMSDLKISKLIGKLNNIHDVVVEDDMPPKKFLEKYPEKVLSKKNKEKISTWALNLANKYGGE